MRPLIWQMLQKTRWFEAETVLCNQALANEQFPFICDFSLSLLSRMLEAGREPGA